MNAAQFLRLTAWVPAFNWKLFFGLMVYATVAYIEGMFHAEGLTSFAWVCHIVLAAMAIRWCGRVYRNRA